MYIFKTKNKKQKQKQKSCKLRLKGKLPQKTSHACDLNLQWWSNQQQKSKGWEYSSCEHIHNEYWTNPNIPLKSWTNPNIPLKSLGFIAVFVWKLPTLTTSNIPSQMVKSAVIDLLQAKCCSINYLITTTSTVDTNQWLVRFTL